MPQFKYLCDSGAGETDEVLSVPVGDNNTDLKGTRCIVISKKGTDILSQP